MNPKCLGGSVPDTFDARSADSTGLKMRRITRAASFDHVVGAADQRQRDCKAERLRGLEIDHEVDLGRLQHRQVGGFCALEDAPGIDPTWLYAFAGVQELGAESQGVCDLLRISRLMHTRKIGLTSTRRETRGA
jgi:hypothetical protein